MIRQVILAAAMIVGCGGSSSSPTSLDATTADAPPDAYDGELASVTGRVWVPNMAPGLTAPGEEIPVDGAIVYLSIARPAEIVPHVYCERCQAIPRGAARSGVDGSFEVKAPPGSYWLVIEKAQFRLEKQIDLTPGSHQLTALETTLPSTHDPENGQWIPHIAVALGTDDWIEDILGKIRLGAVGLNGRYAGTNGDIDAYDNGSQIVEVVGYASQLLADLEKMRQYHIIFIPCSERMAGAFIENPQVRENMRRYVQEGGKLYVTDYSGTSIDMPFPPQLTLGDDAADTIGTYDPADPAVDSVSTFGTSRGANYSSRDAEVMDTGLHDWLALQHGPTPLSESTQSYDPSALDILGNWNWIEALTPVKLGVDHDGHDVYDTPKVWVQGSGGWDGHVPMQKHPLTTTFEPIGCGRVMYSTYHTTGGPHAGLYPQERILLYLIFELGTCQQGPIIE